MTLSHLEYVLLGMAFIAVVAHILLHNRWVKYRAEFLSEMTALCAGFGYSAAFLTIYFYGRNLATVANIDTLNKLYFIFLGMGAYTTLLQIWDDHNPMRAGSKNNPYEVEDKGINIYDYIYALCAMEKAKKNRQPFYFKLENRVLRIQWAKFISGAPDLPPAISQNGVSLMPSVTYSLKFLSEFYTVKMV